MPASRVAVPGGPTTASGRAAGELSVEDQEGEPAEMIAVQVRDELRGDLAGVAPG